MWGWGLPCLIRPLVIWEFCARERPRVSRGLAWALSRRQSLGRSEPPPLSPKPACGGGGREGLSLEESVGAQAPWECLPPHSFLLTFPLVGTPDQRPPAGQAGVPRLGPQTSAQRRASPAQALLSVPRATVPGPRGPSQVGAGGVPRALPAGLPGEQGCRPQGR